MINFRAGYTAPVSTTQQPTAALAGASRKRVIDGLDGPGNDPAQPQGSHPSTRPRLLPQSQQGAQVRLKIMPAVEKCRKIEAVGPITPQHAEIRQRLLAAVLMTADVFSVQTESHQKTVLDFLLKSLFEPGTDLQKIAAFMQQIEKIPELPYVVQAKLYLYHRLTDWRTQLSDLIAKTSRKKMDDAINNAMGGQNIDFDLSRLDADTSIFDAGHDMAWMQDEALFSAFTHLNDPLPEEISEQSLKDLKKAIEKESRQLFLSYNHLPYDVRTRMRDEINASAGTLEAADISKFLEECPSVRTITNEAGKSCRIYVHQSNAEAGTFGQVSFVSDQPDGEQYVTKLFSSTKDRDQELDNYRLLENYETTSRTTIAEMPRLISGGKFDMAHGAQASKKILLMSKAGDYHLEAFHKNLVELYHQGEISYVQLVGVIQDIGRQLFLAIQRFADAGLVHIDLKPRNILIDAGGRLCLVDIGNARKARPNTKYHHQLSTPHYADPATMEAEAMDHASYSRIKRKGKLTPRNGYVVQNQIDQFSATTIMLSLVEDLKAQFRIDLKPPRFEPVKRPADVGWDMVRRSRSGHAPQWIWPRSGLARSSGRSSKPAALQKTRFDGRFAGSMDRFLQENMAQDPGKRVDLKRFTDMLKYDSSQALQKELEKKSTNFKESRRKAGLTETEVPAATIAQWITQFCEANKSLAEKIAAKRQAYQDDRRRQNLPTEVPDAMMDKWTRELASPGEMQERIHAAAQFLTDPLLAPDDARAVMAAVNQRAQLKRLIPDGMPLPPLRIKLPPRPMEPVSDALPGYLEYRQHERDRARIIRLKSDTSRADYVPPPAYLDELTERVQKITTLPPLQLKRAGTR
jgi:serine/threonine protein kinase